MSTFDSSHQDPQGTGATTLKVKAPTRVHIRWMIRRDMPEVLAVENNVFAYPWCEEEFLKVLRQRNCTGMVAEPGETVVGFMIYELHKNKLHILNFAVHADYHRHGIGKQLMAKLVAKLSSHGRTKMVMMVRETNLPGHLFLRSMGWKCIEASREHYADSGEDGYFFQYLYDKSLEEAEDT